MKPGNEVKKEAGVMNRIIRGLKLKRLAALAGFFCMALSVNVFAAGGYTGPIDNLKTVLITIAGSAGVILVVWGGIQLASAFKKMDQNGELIAIRTIVAGGILIGLAAVLAVLGV